MARAIWRGSISFGLVTVPVRLYTAVRKGDVRFRELDRRTGRPVHHVRVSDMERAPHPESPRPYETPPPSAPPPSGGGKDTVPPLPAVSPGDVTRGYEVAPGRFVEVSADDLSELAPERTRTIDIEQFISRKELDAIYLETPYYVVPDLDYVRPFALLLRAMQQTNRAAVCWLVLRSKRHLAALEPKGGLMLLWTLRFADEVLPRKALEPLLPDDLGEREVEMAELLVNTLAGPFDPERYRDEYRDKLLALIAAKTPAEVETPEPPPAPSGVEELMAALSASIEEARRRRTKKREAG